MPTYLHRNHKIYYEFSNEGDGPVVVFINGITQRTPNWANFATELMKSGIRTITYDQIGQGASDKPVLDYDFEENPAILAGLLDHCGVEKAYIGGISFGGAIVLKFALKYPERCAGLIPMSAFTQLDGRLFYQGLCLYQGMVSVGFEYLIDLLIPMNFSSKLIETLEGNIPAVRRVSANINDLYSIQNLIESIQSMPKEGFTADLPQIQCPTLILNGEYDYLTPRWCHELIRKNIKNSRLMLIQHGFHAFTMEYPEISIRVIREFILSVENGSWQGDQSVWIAEDDPKAENVAFPCIGDHTRSIPLITPEDLRRAAPSAPKTKATPVPKAKATPVPKAKLAPAAKPNVLPPPKLKASAQKPKAAPAPKPSTKPVATTKVPQR